MISTKIGKFLRSHVLGFVAIFIALTGTAVAASAVTSAVTNAKFKKLKNRVTALEAKPAPVIPTIPTSLPPSGAAGGVLDGTYPNPGLGDNTVGVTELIDGNVNSAKLAGDSVGARELKGVIFVQGTGVPVADDTSAEATVTCPASHPMVIAGGPEWGEDEPGTSIIYSVPSPGGNPNTTWVVKGRASLTGNTIFAEASCMAD